MKNYTLTRNPAFTQTAWENHVAKAFDVLKGICQGVLADGIVNEQESFFLRDWLAANRDVNSLWPFSDIVARVSRIFADGIVTPEERVEPVVGGETECFQLLPPNKACPAIG